MPKVMYIPEGHTIKYMWRDVETVAVWIDNNITLYKDIDKGDIIGVKIEIDELVMFTEYLRFMEEVSSLNKELRNA